MFSKFVRPLFLSALTLVALASVAGAQHVKSDTLYFEGSATATDSLDIKLVARGYDCTAPAVFAYRQYYDQPVGGAPTTALEVRDAVLVGLAGLPAGYTASAATVNSAPGIIIRTTPGSLGVPYVDICVDGQKILGTGVVDNTYGENGLVVTGHGKGKLGVTTPGASPLVMALIALLVGVSGVFMVRRRVEA